MSSRSMLIFGGLLVGLLICPDGNLESAQTASSDLKTGAEIKPLHPPVPFLDEAGVAVVESGNPVSTCTTCGACHDVPQISCQSYHVSVGLKERFPRGTVTGHRAWDYSTGSFGRWDPIFYRYLSLPGDARLDLGTADWIKQRGWRHVGGGPARFGHGVERLDRRSAVDDESDGLDSDNVVLDPQTAEPTSWDWNASGTVAMNCFLCHLPAPNNQARINELESGRFRWACTATLSGTGLVDRKQDSWVYDKSAFLPGGIVAAETLGLQRPTSEQCGQCHGETHRGSEPLQLDLTVRAWSTATKGQVFAAQRISESAVNLKDKDGLARPWDVHAEAMLECRSCHFSLNNPASFKPLTADQPRHLRFEPRRLSISDYATHPSHQFAKGDTAQGTVASKLSSTMRRCEDCHDAESTHEWLPYRDVHFLRLSCEACHIDQAYAPALRQVDWTMVTPEGEPLVQWRGISGSVDDPLSLVAGFKPVLLPRLEADGRSRLRPFNLVTSWYWVEQGETELPVRLVDLKAALLQDGRYHDEILEVMDANGDGVIGDDERVLDSDQKVAAVRNRLLAVGVKQPRIESEIQPYGLHHGVGPAKTATKSCEHCHASESRLTSEFLLSTTAPGNVLPYVVADAGIDLTDLLTLDDQGQVLLIPSTRRWGLYVLGHDRWYWVNLLGALAVLGTIVGVTGHGLLRWLAVKRQA